MKEFSIEEKAKRYDEAIKRVKFKIKNDKDHVLYGDDVIEIFPELKCSESESTDEKVRKALIKLVTNHASMDLFIEYDIHLDEALSWLEKQGKKKSIWHNEDEEPQRGSLILLIMQSGNPIVAKIIEPNHTFNHGERWAYIDDLLEKQGEQKSIDNLTPQTAMDIAVAKCFEQGEQNPAWSEEDKNMLQSILDEYKSMPIEKRNWLKSLKDRVQPKQEWGEKDTEILNGIANYLFTSTDVSNVEGSDKWYDWLKSLKNRVQNHFN